MDGVTPNRLREAMRAAGKSRRDVADLIDRTEDTVRRLEENRGGPIPSQFIPGLAGFLGVTPEWLMGWDLGRADQLSLDEAAAAGAEK